MWAAINGYSLGPLLFDSKGSNFRLKECAHFMPEAMTVLSPAKAKERRAARTTTTRTGFIAPRDTTMSAP